MTEASPVSEDVFMLAVPIGSVHKERLENEGSRNKRKKQGSEKI